MLTITPERIGSLISRIGRTVTIKTVTKTGPFHDPVISTVSTDVVAAVIPFTSGELDGSATQENDVQFLISGNATITTQDKIEDGGREYEVISISEYSPGMTVNLLRVQGRA